MSALPILLGLSGPSSCGKTTLARLLARIYPPTSILHADDFYYTDSQIPVHNSVQDWDCAEAIDVEKLVRALKRLKAGEDVQATLDGVASTEIPEIEGAESAVDEAVIDRLRQEVTAWDADLHRKRQGWERRPLVIIDGFLLLGDSVPEVRDQLDIKVLLRSKYEDSKQRREARSGYYVTHEGYWEDPPGYFDQIVWPNFVKYHSFLFDGGDVQGQVDLGVADRLGIDVVPGMGQADLEATLLYVWLCFFI